jgi:hypothetical protein
MHTKVREAIAKRGLARSSIVILNALLKLRQACCDPRLLTLSAANAARVKSAKLERLGRVCKGLTFWRCEPIWVG